MLLLYFLCFLYFPNLTCFQLQIKTKNIVCYLILLLTFLEKYVIIIISSIKAKLFISIL